MKKKYYNNKILDAHRKRGLFIHVPYGYVRGEYYGYITPDGETSKIVCEIFRLYRKGYNYTEIFKQVQEHGFNHTIQMMQRIIGNKRVYQGYYKYKDVWYKGRHERILPMQPSEIVLGDDYNPNEEYDDDKRRNHK